MQGDLLEYAGYTQAFAHIAIKHNGLAEVVDLKRQRLGSIGRTTGSLDDLLDHLVEGVNLVVVEQHPGREFGLDRLKKLVLMAGVMLPQKNRADNVHVYGAKLRNDLSLPPEHLSIHAYRGPLT